jgi:hypothetical protein
MTHSLPISDLWLQRCPTSKEQIQSPASKASLLKKLLLCLLDSLSWFFREASCISQGLNLRKCVSQMMRWTHFSSTRNVSHSRSFNHSAYRMEEERHHHTDWCLWSWPCKSQLGEEPVCVTETASTLRLEKPSPQSFFPTCALPTPRCLSLSSTFRITTESLGAQLVEVGTMQGHCSPKLQVHLKYSTTPSQDFENKNQGVLA